MRIFVADMRQMTRFLFVSVLITCLFVAAGSAQQRRVMNMDYGWEFSRDSLFTQVERIDIPHDFQISQPWVAPEAHERADNSNAAANTRSRLSARGFKEMGEGWYRKTISQEDVRVLCQRKEGADSIAFRDVRLLLDFEGIMLVGDIFLDGVRIGGTDYGYVGFEIDVSDRLKLPGDHVLTVRASTMHPENSRWYTGGGLIRPVTLTATNGQLFFARHPLCITTRENRYVNVSAEYTNLGKSRTVTMAMRIYAPDGTLVCERTESHRRNTPLRTAEMHFQELEVPDAQLWDTESPRLYQAVVRLMLDDGTVVDEVAEEFGIRTVEMTPDHGLLLNGRKVLLKGFANHHTLGLLGAAAYPRANEQLLMLMKQFGINHVRTSHNPYSRDFIRQCDRLGILVVDELYDKWTQQHTGGRVLFMNHWAADVTEWVKRDRNSPSVILWSLGNELQQEPHQPFNDFGVTCYEMMRPVVQRYDSTRLVTVAMHPRYRNWQTDSLPCELAMHTDVQAYNYRYMYFPGDGRRYPWMRFYQSEASVAAMGRNFFEMDLDRVIGLAYWGVVDYLGESQGWPAKGWAQGVFDITLQPKPRAWFMKSLFSDAPVVHIGVTEQRGDEMWNGVQTGVDVERDHWNYTEGQLLDLVTYTNADEVELVLNGRSLGIRQNNRAVGAERNQIRWKNVSWQPGAIEAIARTAGKVVARHRIETAGKAVALRLEADHHVWHADGQDLQQVRVTAVDRKGRRVPQAELPLAFTIQGPARTVATGNGDISSHHVATAEGATLYQGTALVVLRSDTVAGPVRLTVTALGLPAVSMKLQTQRVHHSLLTVHP